MSQLSLLGPSAFGPGASATGGREDGRLPSYDCSGMSVFLFGICNGDRIVPERIFRPFFD